MRQETEEHPDKTHDPVTRLSLVLYIAFFLVWCAGAGIGLAWSGAQQPALRGAPLWFAVACLLSFAGVSLALIHGIRKCLK